jgi:D-tyrosyl-tRNA(Tyr) deacylase
MKAIIQRVKKASVYVNKECVGTIDKGILTLIGFEKNDTEENLNKLIKKILFLRIFEDDKGKMNLSLLDIKGSHLIVSQFTLSADTSSGLRPSFTSAENPEKAKALYEKAIQISKNYGIHTESGIFQANMEVELINDGPATFIL